MENVTVHLKDLKSLLPDFPRTPHLPYSHTHDDDVMAGDADASLIFHEDKLTVEEKVDGANCGMAFLDGNPILRNRTKILSKAFIKDTPAKKQFRHAWNWMYKYRDNFDKLYKKYGAFLGVYGEWMQARHTIFYDKLPSLFIAYDIYDPEERKFLDTETARELLISSGFVVPELIHRGKIVSYEWILEEATKPSVWSSGSSREGVYVKISRGDRVVKRFKMVRTTFQPAEDWNDKPMEENIVQR